MDIKFRGEDLKLGIRYYSNGRPALEVFNKDGEPDMIASVNLPEQEIAPNEIAVRNYSGNKGILESLMESGIVSEPLRHVSSGFVSIPICTLLWDGDE